MATNGIEILIDVLAKEGITSIDQFIKVMTDAAGKAETLSGSIDGLDTALASIAKSGAGAEEMAATLVASLEDFGIQVKDADGLAKSFADALKGLGTSGKEAATGVESAAKANESIVGPTDSATAAIDRETASLELLATRSRLTSQITEGFAAKQVASSIASQAALADLGTGYAKMTQLSEMATPALMKAASWAGIGLAGLAYEGIKQYTQFNKLITQTITQAGEAPSKMGFLTGLAESVAKSTGQHLNDVANTIYRAASGTAAWNNGLGATKKQLEGIVTSVSRLNVVGGIAPGAESEQASRVITALINSNIRGVGKDPNKAAALVNAVVGSGDMRLADLVPGIGRGLLSSAVANNMTAQDAMAWVATLTSQGTTASVAGNYVKTGVNLLAHPSAQGVQALAMLGIKPGELENLMSGPGGLVAALSTLKSGMKHLNPGNAAQFFYHEAGIPRPGGAGLQGAVAKLQTWSAGELSPKFISDWINNRLTSQEQTQATDLILTKAFGGSKQFATIAAVINNLGLVKGIEGHISAENSVGYFNKQYAITAATPQQQFKRMQQSIIVDLVNIGKELTPLGLTVAHAITGVIDGLSKFKVVLYGFVGIAASLLAFAGAAKVATLASHIAPFIGAGYNRLALMAGGKDSVFSKRMLEGANSGRFKFLNIYGAKKTGILAKMGGEAIANGGLSTEAIAGGAQIRGLSQGENVLNGTIAKGVTFEEETAANTRAIADAMTGKGFGGAGGGAGGGGLANVGGSGGAAEKAAQREASMATTTPRDAMYFGTAKNAKMAEGTVFRDAKTGRWTKVLSGGRRSFISNAEAYASGAMNGPPALGAGSAERMTASGSADAIALAEKAGSSAGYVSSFGSAGLATKTAAMETGNVGGLVADAAGSGLMSTIGEGLGGLMGGPVGMIGMMMAPALISSLAPSIMKLGSMIGGWFNGGKTPVYNPNLHNPLDVSTAAAKLAAATKNLHAYQKKIKNKAGKEVWVNNQSAQLADMAGYAAAQIAYTKAGGANATALKNASKIDMTAEGYLYGSHKNSWQNALAIDARRSNEAPLMGVTGPARQEAALKKYIASLPGGPNGILQKSIWKRIRTHGTTFASDYKDIIAPALRNQNQYYHKVFNDASSQSLQSLRAEHAGALAQMLGDGLFSNNTALKLNKSEMTSFINNPKTTSKEAARYLSLYANKYHQIYKSDQGKLAATGADRLTGDARKAFLDQEKYAKEQVSKTDALVREMRKVSEDTKLNEGSIQSLAKQNAASLVASGLPQEIADALAKALSQYIKYPKVVGTSGPVSRTKLLGAFPSS